MPELINSSKPAVQLSKLQKYILKVGLRAYLWTAPVRRAWAGGSLAAASFNGAPVLIEFYGLTKEEVRRPSGGGTQAAGRQAGAGPDCHLPINQELEAARPARGDPGPGLVAALNAW
jgi:hypothetical protein